MMQVDGAIFPERTRNPCPLECCQSKCVKTDHWVRSHVRGFTSLYSVSSSLDSSAGVRPDGGYSPSTDDDAIPEATRLAHCSIAATLVSFRPVIYDRSARYVRGFITGARLGATGDGSTGRLSRRLGRFSGRWRSENG